MIRPARVEDAAAIATLQHRAWQRSYLDFIDHDRLAERTVEERTDRWTLLLGGELALPGGTIVVWEQEEVGVVGVAGWGRCRDDGAGPGTGELWILYVDPAAQGAGVGSALLEHAEVSLAGEGFATGSLWVYEANGHGRHFYERRGWSLVDGSRAHPADWLAAGVRYAKVLRAP